MSTSGRSEPARTPTPALSSTEKDVPRIHTPDTYHGQRHKLKQFVLQYSMYLAFNQTKFANEPLKVMWISSFLRDTAAHWIEPALNDYLENKHSSGACSQEMKEASKVVFRTVDGFTTELKKVFGDPDEQEQAEKHLLNIRQRGNVHEYTAEFQRYAMRLDWTNGSLRAQYYKGLKDYVKDELSRAEKTDTLEEIIRTSVGIDERILERKRERQGYFAPSHFRKPKYPAYYGKRNNEDRGDPMELDAAHRGSTQKQPWKKSGFQKKPMLSPEKREEYMKKGLCFQCGQSGHMASFHRKGKGRQLNATGPARMVAYAGRGGHNEPHPEENPEDQEEGPALDNGPEEEDWPYGTQPPVRDSDLENDSWEELAVPSPEKESQASGREDYTNLLPEVNEIWECQLAGRACNVWYPIGIEKPSFTAARLPRAIPPNQSRRYKVVYCDVWRIAFQPLAPGELTVVERVPTDMDEEPQELDEVLEPGEVWEIFEQPSQHERIWRRVVTYPFRPESTEYARQEIPFPATDFLMKSTPYRLIKWADNVREWEDQISESVQLEFLAKRQLAAVGYGHLTMTTKVKGQPFTVMIDSGAQGNFISPDTVQRLNIPFKQKNVPYPLIVVDGTAVKQNKGMVTQETIPFRVTFGNHSEEISMDIASIGKNEAILGTPWIKLHNPEIDWNLQEREVSATSSNAPGPPTEGPPPMELPVKYREFSRLFEDPKDFRALPKHQPWDHEINLKEGKEPPSQKLRSHNPRVLAALEEYVREASKKGWIRESKSPAASNMLMVKKKNDPKGRPCVDYRELNDMTIRDVYPLPTLQSLRDSLGRAVIFTKLDQRTAFALIRIKEGHEWKTAFLLPSGLWEYTVMPIH